MQVYFDKNQEPYYVEEETSKETEEEEGPVPEWNQELARSFFSMKEKGLPKEDAWKNLATWCETLHTLSEEEKLPALALLVLRDNA